MKPNDVFFLYIYKRFQHQRNPYDRRAAAGSSGFTQDNIMTSILFIAATKAIS
jgi:hypothetical protein